MSNLPAKYIKNKIECIEAKLCAIQDISNNQSISLSVISAKSKLHKMQTEADDLVETYTYLDPGNPVDRRISTIVYTSTLLALSVTETFAYAGIPGDFYVISSTLS